MVPAAPGRASGAIEHRFVPEDEADLAALFAHYARARILCATRARGLSTSADSINDVLHARLHAVFGKARARQRGQRGQREGARFDFSPGEPVIVQHNDYDRDLYNGDHGVVVRVDDGSGASRQRMAVFARTARSGAHADRVGKSEGFVAVAIDAMARELAPAFATTVHKSQGSEVEAVALVLPDEDHPLVTRELVYTALTRARRSALVVGSRAVLEAAVRRTAERQSGVAEKLATATKEASGS
jgi:exodeoxyribonuclease V alpha subunit